MCLLSFVKLKDSYIFTSNRDININRPAAEKLSTHLVNDYEVNFPRDHKGGSWLVSNHNSLMILLNGAKENHTPKETYRKSRGIVLIDLFTKTDKVEHWKKYNLSDIEPFTIVYFDENNNLMEMIWDSEEKEISFLSSSENRIWQSSTLYTLEERRKVNQTFSETEFLTLDDVLMFNKVHTYQTVKEESTRIKQVETTCHYQLYRDGDTVVNKEFIL